MSVEPPPTISDIIRVHDTLNQLLSELDIVSILDEFNSAGSPSIESVQVLSRRLAPTSHAPTFIRFNPDSGPLEAFPERFRVPFPTMEDLRFSFMNAPNPFRSKAAEPAVLADTVSEVDDDYVNDF